jgi:hypothetical protein
MLVDPASAAAVAVNIFRYVLSEQPQLNKRAPRISVSIGFGKASESAITTNFWVCFRFGREWCLSKRATSLDHKLFCQKLTHL